MNARELETAFDTYSDPVFRFVWRMTGSDAMAEDIAQDTFCEILRRPDRYQPARGEIRSFLFGIARNLALKRLRDLGRWDVLDEEQFVAEPFDPLRDVTARAVSAAVQSLPVLQREVLILAEYEGLTLEEIARAVQAETGTVKSRLFRARENLRRILAPLKESTNATT
jgi:RNA polymerase sigma-70 factor (ECF subfamily)